MQRQRFRCFIFIIMLSLLLAGCDHRLQFDKAVLAPAMFGKSYSEVIQIEDVKLIYTHVETDLPKESGLNIQVDEKTRFFSENVIVIDGIPKVRGHFNIRIYGKFRGGAFGQVIDFNKTYTLQIH